MEKTGKYAVIAFVIAGGLIAGPKFYEKYIEAKTNREAKKAQEKLDQERTLAAQDAQYRDYIWDSVLTAQGFHKNESFYSQALATDAQINELRWKQSPGGKMENAVFTSNKQILKQYMDKLHTDLTKYGLDVLNIKEITGDMCQNPEIIMCGAYQDAGLEDMYLAKEYLVSEILSNINFCSYGECHREEVTQTIDNLVTEMFTELHANRKHIEKTFAKYFTGGQQTINENSIIYCGEYDYCAGYNRTNINTNTKKQLKSRPFDKEIKTLSLRKDSLLKKNEEYKNALNVADSVAQIKLQQHVANRTRIK